MTTPTLYLVVLRCADLERSRAFYAALGLDLVAEQHESGPAHYAAELGGVVLELYPGTGHAAVTARLGFRVRDVGATVDAVRAAAAGEVIRFDGARASLRDPDGNTVLVDAT